MAPEKEDYFQKLIDLMQILRSPEGCPWDREQTRESLKPMLVEECYEVLDALDSDDSDELCEELGDLLFQVIFHSQIADENEEFDAHDVCRRVYEKMVGRHPHVFGDAEIRDSAELLRNWESLKAAEKQSRGETSRKKSLIDGIPSSLPPIYTTYQVTAKASRVGFDWPELQGIKEKIEEEFSELEAALDASAPERVREEVGDLLFAAINVARYLEIDPETALKEANRKFIRRFQLMEKQLGDQGIALEDADLAQMDEIWNQLKNGAE